VTFEVIITTYNRPLDVVRLVKQVLQCYPRPQNVIVVDSSDMANFTLQALSDVVYVRSSHRNQPYQRLLGSYVAKSEIVIYLDDDLVIVKRDVFNILLEAYLDLDVAGVAVAFEYENSNLVVDNSGDYRVMSRFNRYLLALTGVPMPGVGKISRLGVSGGNPEITSCVQSFSGAVMSFRKETVRRIIPDDLMTQVELKASMGEDKVISMLALKYGKLMFIPEVCFIHPANQSTYFRDARSFAAKVIYSRRYLSHIYSEVFGTRYWKEDVRYLWFAIWRLIISLISLTINYSKSKKDRFLGIMDGVKLAFLKGHSTGSLLPDLRWADELHKDLLNVR